MDPNSFGTDSTKSSHHLLKSSPPTTTMISSLSLLAPSTVPLTTTRESVKIDISAQSFTKAHTTDKRNAFTGDNNVYTEKVDTTFMEAPMFHVRGLTTTMATTLHDSTTIPRSQDKDTTTISIKALPLPQTVHKNTTAHRWQRTTSSNTHASSSSASQNVTTIDYASPAV